MRTVRWDKCATAVLALAATVCVGACAASSTETIHATAGSGVPAAGDAAAAPPLQAHPNLAEYRSARTFAEVAPPVRLRIPAIGVDTGLEELLRANDGSIEAPRQVSSAGWWAGGPRPGQVGPAVILGHVDSRTGPAVFFRLRELAAGDEVLVDRADGTTARFLITSLERHAKNEFPSELVYYPTLEPELRLVTCGGPIDSSTGHYRDNLVAFGVQAG